MFNVCHGHPHPRQAQVQCKLFIRGRRATATNSVSLRDNDRSQCIKLILIGINMGPQHVHSTSYWGEFGATNLKITRNQNLRCVQRLSLKITQQYKMYVSFDP